MPCDQWAFVKLVTTRSESYDDVTVFTQEDHTYDDTNGNLFSTVASGSGVAESVTKTKQYSNYGDWLWRITQETVTGSTSGQVRSITYTHDTLTGNLLTKTAWLDGGANPSVSMTYGAYGNLKTKTDANGNTTTYFYDLVAHAFTTRVVYPNTGVAHEEQYTYDYRFGKPNLAIDENGNETATVYDEFGRVVAVCQYSGSAAGGGNWSPRSKRFITISLPLKCRVMF